LIEDFADGRITPEQMRLARVARRINGPTDAHTYAARAVRLAAGVHTYTDEFFSLPVATPRAAADVAISVQFAAEATEAESAHQCHLLRDIFGNPFRPATFDPAWPAGPVPGLAQAAYIERLLPSGELDRARLTILADALEENGASPDILAHLRSPGPHVRGCWVVDLCTGRA
jgi:hypothetical protein